jgi:hypothetical protein
VSEEALRDEAEGKKEADWTEKEKEEQKKLEEEKQQEQKEQKEEEEKKELVEKEKEAEKKKKEAKEKEEVEKQDVEKQKAEVNERTLRRKKRKMEKNTTSNWLKTYGAIKAPTRTGEGFKLIAGNLETCLADAVLHAMLMHGVREDSIRKGRFRSLTVPQLGNDPQASWSTCQQAILDLSIPFKLERVPTLLTVKGGPMLALIRETVGVFVVGLLVVVAGVENRHCVAYSASKGTFLDNASYTKPVRLEAGDGRGKDSAKAVFRFLIGQRMPEGTQFSVNIVDIWELRNLDDVDLVISG